MRMGFLRAGLTLLLMLGAAKAPASPVDAGGLPPWQFGMTSGEVASFAAYGPYKTFSNGDLETYAGLFNGRRQNVQFFFREDRLVRIGVYLYEGEDVDAGARAWGDAYAALKTQFGEIEVPDVDMQPVDGKAAPDALAVAAKRRVLAAGKTQMAPVKQAADKFVFASFFDAEMQGRVFYYVVVYYNPPHG